jgi:hypothetical protein
MQTPIPHHLPQALRVAIQGARQQPWVPLSAMRTPDDLFHYTRWEGLEGILTHGFLATDVSTLDDVTEMNYGADLVGKVTLEMGRDLQPDDPREVGEFIHSFRDLDPPAVVRDGFAARPTRAYTTSFCTDGDEMDMWDRYGRGGGYSIGLMSHFMNVRPDNFFEPEHPFLRVVYDEGEQRQTIRDSLALGVGAVRALAGQMTGSDVAEYFIPQFAPLLLAFKSADFSVEREWRALWLPAPEVEIVETEGRRRQVSIDLRGGPWGFTADRLPVISITVGPCPHPNTQIELVSSLLDRLRYPHVRISASRHQRS